MLAARAMHARTGEERFAELWRASARELLARQEEDGLWTQDLFGRHQRLIGAAHGFAGNILALSAAPEWLDDAGGRGGPGGGHGPRVRDRRWRPRQLVIR